MENENKKRPSDTHQENSAQKISHTSNDQTEADALWFKIADDLVKEEMAFDKRWREKEKSKKEAGQSSKRQR